MLSHAIAFLILASHCGSYAERGSATADAPTSDLVSAVRLVLNEDPTLAAEIMDTYELLPLGYSARLAPRSESHPLKGKRIGPYFILATTDSKSRVPTHSILLNTQRRYLSMSGEPVKDMLSAVSVHEHPAEYLVTTLDPVDSSILGNWCITSGEGPAHMLFHAGYWSLSPDRRFKGWIGTSECRKFSYDGYFLTENQTLMLADNDENSFLRFEYNSDSDTLEITITESDDTWAGTIRLIRTQPRPS